MSLLVQWRWKMTFSTLALAKRTSVAAAFFFTFALKIIVRKSRYRVHEIYCLEIFFFPQKGNLLRVEARTLSLFFFPFFFIVFIFFTLLFYSICLPILSIFLLGISWTLLSVNLWSRSEMETTETNLVF